MIETMDGVRKRLLDVVEHPEMHSAQNKKMVVEILDNYLTMPMSTDETAKLLEISKPTILGWIKAGLIPEAQNSKPTKRLISRTWEIAVQEHIETVRNQMKEANSTKQKAEIMLDFLEDLFLIGHPEELSSLKRGIAEAEAGLSIPIRNSRMKAARKRAKEKGKK
jgi:excisionase family DNA binding protein